MPGSSAYVTMRHKNPTVKEIKNAREVLGLPAFASLAEIKKAYRKKCQRWHPDTAGGKDLERHNQKMQAINEAYQVLLSYCQNYRYCLEPKEEDTDENWWMDRFGQDPLWSSKRQKD
ncbi:MAG: J domain-containing protein [Thermodesulfobacteriota bacterium]